jgi:hypothetical protein
MAANVARAPLLPGHPRDRPRHRGGLDIRRGERGADRPGGRDQDCQDVSPEVLPTPGQPGQVTSVAAAVLATTSGEGRISEIAVEALVSVVEVPTSHRCL